MASKKDSQDRTATQRKRNERDRMREAGFTRRDVWAHPDDWEQIKALEMKLRDARLDT